MTPATTPIYTAGIDVSHYQLEIDWAAVAASGIKFAYIKATEGTSYCDPNFHANAFSAHDAGILVGAYHFLTKTARFPNTVNAQVAWFRKMLVDCPVDLPPALDVEEAVNPADVLAWLDGIDSPTNAVLYCNLAYARMLTAACPDLTDHALWIAEYDVTTPRITPWDRWTFWQHAEGGRVPGISTPVDLDWYNGSLDALRVFAGLPAATTLTSTPAST